MKIPNASQRLDLIDKCLHESISKDETRPNLSGVYFCPETKSRVSCDGHRLTITATGYSDRMSGLIFNPVELQVINREYPKHQTIIPTKSPNRTFIVDFPSHLSYMAHSPKHPVKTYLQNDGTLSHERKEDSLACFNPYYLKPFKGLKMEVGYYDANSPIKIYFFDSYNEEHLYLLMPLKMD